MPSGGSDGMDSGALVEGETVTREESMEFFQEQIMNHSVDAPERGMVGVFSLPEVEKLAVAAVAAVVPDLIE